MLQRRIWWAFLLVLTVGVAVSIRIVTLGDSVQAVNRMFIAEKLPLSQRIGELRGVIADEERLLYEYYSYTATRETFKAQRALNAAHLVSIVDQLDKDSESHEQVRKLRARLAALDGLSDELSATLSSNVVNWDLARAILAQVKPNVRQIENTLAAISMANRQAVDKLGSDSRSSVATMVRWVIGFSVLIFGVAFFVGYYVVAIIREGLERRRLAMFAERNPNPVLRIGTSGAVHYANPATAEMLAKLNLPPADSGALLPADLQQNLDEARLNHSTNRQFEYAHGKLTLECTVAYLAFFDPASGLPNQYRLREDLGAAFSQQRAGTVMTAGTGSDAAQKAEAQVQQAASACNRVRRAGGNDFAIYDEAMGRAAAMTLRMITDLQHAVNNEELRLYYQPKVDAGSGRLVGMEALVRWMHPERGMISPIEFIPVAEDTGMIVAIGRWVLREACRQNAQWQQAGLRPIRVAVNLSARQFRSDNLPEEINAALIEAGLPASSLELEITESMVMEDPERVIDLLDKIRNQGIHLSLDDFGTGHSSLAYLKRFPIDCVKIDRAFIKDMPGNTDDVAIAKTIVAMAKALDLTTVAEGVETAAQLEVLKNMGCDQIQGYFFSRPLPAEDFLAFYSNSQ